MALPPRSGSARDRRVIVAGVVFDAYPYSLLGIILAIEAILITSFVLIS